MGDGGGSIEEVKGILGLYSVVVTKRYAHLRPDLFATGAHGALVVDCRHLAGWFPWRMPSICPVGATTAVQVIVTTNEVPEPPCKPGSPVGEHA